MKKLLIATDLSPRSDRALERAVHLASGHGADLTVVHVVDEDLPEFITDAQATAAKPALREQIDTLTAGNGPRISIEVVCGRPHTEILEISQSTETELIVLGVHRDDVLKDMFRGTTAERVMRAGNVPVLLVKERTSGPYLRIMVGVDFSVCSRRAFRVSVGLVPTGHFHLVHAYDVPFKGFLSGEETRKEVSKQHAMQFKEMVAEEMAAFVAGLEAKAPKLEQIMAEGAARDVIFQQVRRLKPDLLAIGTHGRTGAAHVVLGSVAEDQLRAPPAMCWRLRPGEATRTVIERRWH